MRHKVLAITSMLMLDCALATAQVTFTQTGYTGSGGNTSGESSGDFNRDGKPDLAVGAGSNVDIWTNIGGGKFSGPVSYAVTGVVGEVRAADLNNDGFPDLVVLAQQPHGYADLDVLLNTGNGTFTFGSQIVTKLTPQRFAVGDLNGDGKLDLAVFECDVNNVSHCQFEILKGTGTGSFTGGQLLAVANQDVSGPVLADVNGDGKLDLINTRTPKVFVWPGTGTGTFGTPTSFQPPTVCNGSTCTDSLSSIALGDFNSDARLDIAVLQGHWCVAACDTNGSNTLYIYKNNGGFSFSHVSTSTPPGSAGGTLLVTDLNGDQNMDLIVSNGDLRFGYREYLPGKGNFTFGSASNLPNTAGEALARDFNLDSRHDLTLTSGIFPDWYGEINSSGYANCAPPSSANVAAKVCKPGSGSTHSSPVLITGSGNSPTGIQRLEIWVDGVKKYQKWNDQVARKISLGVGSHRISVVAIDAYKGSAKTSVTINVQ